MSSTPRIIATTASAAILAATGAGAAVLAVDMATSGANQAVDASTTETLNGLKTPQDDRTTVYRSPEDDSDEHEQSTSKIQPAPPSTTYQGGNGGQSSANTSKSS
ncbi:MAG: hypothetical protein R2720_06855 [Candidatus Nanopelagicales bacterium]